MAPLLSICIPAYNRPFWLRRALESITVLSYDCFNQKSSAPRGGVWKSFARKPLVSIASLYFSPQGAGNYTHTRLKSENQRLMNRFLIKKLKKQEGIKRIIRLEN